ncbi:MAG: class I SAM-dependent methyltransferase [Phycisphaerae bacterium]
MSERLSCGLCGGGADPADAAAFATFRCNVRAFRHERFRVWRCPQCRCLHCRDVVDLAKYYAPYPFKKAQLNWAVRAVYRNLLSRLRQARLDKRRPILDYGCGNGNFVRFLRERGFAAVSGYDPYGAPDGFGDPAALEQGPFDCIVLQDVIEHVEEPATLVRELDRHLAPGGHILIGTPNAERIDLARPDDFMNEVHVPYHLHILTPAKLEELGGLVGWRPVAFFDRAYHDYPLHGLNTRAGRAYQRLFDDTVDVLFDPPRIGRALTSPRYLFEAFFGYWLSRKADMSILFHKPRG